MDGDQSADLFLSKAGDFSFFYLSGTLQRVTLGLASSHPWRLAFPAEI